MTILIFLVTSCAISGSIWDRRLSLRDGSSACTNGRLFDVLNNNSFTLCLCQQPLTINSDPLMAMWKLNFLCKRQYSPIIQPHQLPWMRYRNSTLVFRSFCTMHQFVCGGGVCAESIIMRSAPPPPRLPNMYIREDLFIKATLNLSLVGSLEVCEPSWTNTREIFDMFSDLVSTMAGKPTFGPCLTLGRRGIWCIQY